MSDLRASNRKRQHSKYKAFSFDADFYFGSVDKTPVCITLQRNQIDLLAAVIEYQRWPSRWHGNVPSADTLNEFVDQIIHGLFDEQDCGSVGDCEDNSCIELNAFHPAISYWPNHPVLSPDYYPLPYGHPVWLTGAGFFLGQPTDAMINPLSILNFTSLQDLIEVGLPAVNINFEGAGEVDLHFAGQVQGGSAWVFPDGNPLLGDFVDLNVRDITDFASTNFIFDLLELAQGDQTGDIVHTMEFATSGPHTITAWFIPSFEIEPPFVGVGGGLRAVQLCGPTIGESVMPVNYSLACLDGVITLMADDAPVSSIDLAACGITGPAGPPGADGADGADGAPGAPGADGASVELRTDSGFIQWRQDDDSPSWTNLIDIDDLQGATGPQGPQGATGPQGPPGADGADGADCECETAPAPAPDPVIEDDSEGRRCSIAVQMTAWVKAIHDQQVTQIGAAIDISQVVLSAAALIANPILLGIVAAAEAIQTLGTSIINTENDVDFWENVQCNLFCLLPEDGVITQGTIDEWSASLAALNDVGNIPVRALIGTGIGLEEYRRRAYAYALDTRSVCVLCDPCPETPPEDVSAQYWVTGIYRLDIDHSASGTDGIDETDTMFIPGIPGAVALLVDSETTTVGAVNCAPTSPTPNIWNAPSGPSGIYFALNNSPNAHIERRVITNHAGLDLAGVFNTLDFEDGGFVGRGSPNTDHLNALRAGGALDVRTVATGGIPASNKGVDGHVNVRIIVQKSITPFPG